MKRIGGILAIGLTLSSSAFSEEYISQSVFNKSYKCIADEEGGFNHNATGHKLVSFKPETEFYLVHISSIPKRAVLKMKSKDIVKKLNNDESQVRKAVEHSYMDQSIDDYKTIKIVNEIGSYFLLTPSDNPQEMSSYFKRCKSQQFTNKENNSASTYIDCYTESQDYTFSFSPRTGRFTYSYIGSWHNNSMKNYYGDSSVFAFGTCKEYYR